MAPLRVGLTLSVAAVLVLAARLVWAQSDEIQVYTGEINQPGQLSITLHNNYTAIGRDRPDFAGALVPQHALNGVPELAYGVRDWFELGAYVPLYSLTGDGRLLFDGAKVRALVGGRLGRLTLTLNPIVDVPFANPGQASFAPAVRLAGEISTRWEVAIESYQDYGPLADIAAPRAQGQTIFAVGDYNGHSIHVEAGVGHGFTAASDALVVKLMLTVAF